jgi:hypothetical protein
VIANCAFSVFHKHNDSKFAFSTAALAGYFGAEKAEGSPSVCSSLIERCKRVSKEHTAAWVAKTSARLSQQAASQGETQQLHLAGANFIGTQCFVLAAFMHALLSILSTVFARPSRPAHAAANAPVLLTAGCMVTFSSSGYIKAVCIAASAP